MNLLISIVLAGSFTIFAPCTLTISPTSASASIGERSLLRTLTAIISAALSIIIFTLLLKSTTTLLFVPDLVWKLASGATLLFLGITFLSPTLWQYTSIGKNALPEQSPNERAEFLRSMMIGLSIGPIFNTCSPTYSFISAGIIPEKFLIGLGILLIFVIGFCLSFGMLSTFFQQVSTRLFPNSTNPFGLTKKILGIVLFTIGIMIIFGWDKDLEAFILEHYFFKAPFEYEQKILTDLKEIVSR